MRSCLFAKCKPGEYSNGVEVRLGHHYSGGGDGAFGYLKGDDNREWPALHVELGFPHGREDLRDALADRMKALIDRFLAKHGLD